MTNVEIVELENKVMNLNNKIKVFSKFLVPTRHVENYNYLGTLDVNLKVLKTSMEDLIEKLDF